MNGTGIEQPEPSQEKVTQQSDPNFDGAAGISESTEFRPDTCDAVMESPQASGELSFQIERFSNLSDEMTSLLLQLSQEVQQSADQLQSIRLAVDSKKKELKTLHDIEASAISLSQLIEDHRQQREDLERSMENQRNAWEEEKTWRAQEEKEYLENLKNSREREEQEYQEMRALERLRAQQKLEAELREVEQKSLEKREALERELLEREQRLNENEEELARLTQELERFMSRLAGHAQSRSAVLADSHGEVVPAQPDPAASSAFVSREEAAALSESKDSSQPSHYPKDDLVPEKAYEKGNLSRDLTFGSCLDGRAGGPFRS